MKPVSIKQQHEKDLAKFLEKYLRSTETATREVFLSEKVFLEFREIHRKILAPESLFQ